MRCPCRICGGTNPNISKHRITCGRGNCYSIFQEARSKACRAVGRAVAKGILPRIGADTKCADCGGKATEYEHRDYSKPLDVQPVCRPCNHKRGPAVVSDHRHPPIFLPTYPCREGGSGVSSFRESVLT